MDLDELRAVQNKERQKDSLQHLRESFYGDVADYVAELERQRDRAAEAADDPFASREVRQLTDEIETVREVAEAVYERRLGKLVKRASLAAADMPADAEGLTAEERELFDDIVDRIEDNKQRVLDVVEGGDDPDSGPERAGPAATDDGPSVDAADVMGASGEAAADPSTEDRPVPPSGEGRPPSNVDPSAHTTDAERPSGEEVRDSPGGESPTPGSEATDGGVAAHETDEPGVPGGEGEGTVDTDGLDDRTTVRITDDVGEIFGVDDRDYDLSADDVVTLPVANAEPLLDRDAAERID